MNAITAADALAIAVQELSEQLAGDIEVVILEDQTMDIDLGWVFFYESLRALVSGDFGDRLLGNDPLLVTRDGELWYLGTHAPIDDLLDELRSALRADGDR